MRHLTGSVIAGGTLALLILGCDVADRADGSVIAYDSAGVKVVVVPVRDAEADGTWSIGASPIWSVGDHDEEPGHQLHQVVGAVRFADGRVAVANAGSNEFRFFLRREIEPRRVLPEHVEERRREIREGTPDSPARGLFERRLESAPGTLPPYERMLIDAEGVLWVGRYTAPGDQARVWDLFHLDEGMIATLEVPPDLSILEVGTAYVLGVRTDELGIEVVEVYPLRRGG